MVGGGDLAAQMIPFPDQAPPAAAAPLTDGSESSAPQTENDDSMQLEFDFNSKYTIEDLVTRIEKLEAKIDIAIDLLNSDIKKVSKKSTKTVSRKSSKDTKETSEKS
jgi:hypothetical protein